MSERTANPDNDPRPAESGTAGFQPAPSLLTLAATLLQGRLGGGTSTSGYAAGSQRVDDRHLEEALGVARRLADKARKGPSDVEAYS